MKIKERDFADEKLKPEALVGLSNIAERFAAHISMGEFLRQNLGDILDIGPTRVALSILIMAAVYDQQSGKPCSPEEFGKIAATVKAQLIEAQIAKKMQAPTGGMKH